MSWTSSNHHRGITILNFMQICGHVVKTGTAPKVAIWDCPCYTSAPSADTETNPGPRTPKFPCQLCGKAVRWNQKAIACDHCSTWLHTACINMPSQEYERGVPSHGFVKSVTNQTTRPVYSCPLWQRSQQICTVLCLILYYHLTRMTRRTPLEPHSTQAKLAPQSRHPPRKALRSKDLPHIGDKTLSLGILGYWIWTAKVSGTKNMS